MRGTAARILAAFLVSLLLARCGGTEVEISSPSAASPSTLREGSTHTPPPAVEPALDPPVLWRPGRGEPEPELKLAAAELLRVLATYDIGDGSIQAARSRLGAAGFDPSIARQGRALLVRGASSAGDVVYPQLGGLQGDLGDAMVVLRQRLLAGGDERAVTRTIDVRLVRRQGRWVPVGIASTGGRPPADRVGLTDAARAVLRSEEIELSDSARWDILAGRIDERVLRVLADLARDHTLGVTVLVTGHPTQVFGTERTSNHTAGRAADVWSIDGLPVAAQNGDDSPLREIVRSLLAAGVTELGSPWDLDGPGGDSFTDVVHQDHIHIGFDG